MSKKLIEELQIMLGAGNVLGGDDAAAVQYLTDSYGCGGMASAVVFPRDVASLKKLVVLANQEKYALLPMGGNTGRSQGALMQRQPDRPTIIVAMKYFDKILSVNEKNNSMMVESGVVLATIHDAAEKIGRSFPVALGSAGSCQIGGVLATNAGGYNVHRYGMARAHLLGLSVMLPGGDVLSQMTATRKDNSGYDVKQLFVGAEGTLGFILAANIALIPKASNRIVGLMKCAGLKAAVELYHQFQDMVGPWLAGFELIPDGGRKMLMAQGKKIPSFFLDKKNHDSFYLLFEIDNFFADNGGDMIAEQLTRHAAAGDIIAMAKNENEARALWGLREDIVWGLQGHEPVARHDIALPLDAWADGGATTINAAVEKIAPGAIPFVFGHVGDGNLHYHFLCPDGWAREKWDKTIPAIHAAVYDAVVKLGGSFSAEHGIGREKLAAWRLYQPPMMQHISRQIKQLFDPNNIMNPGVIFNAEE